MQTLTYNPAEGAARQGDVLILPLPAGFKVDRDSASVALEDGRLILARGEATGHHHSILAHMFAPPQFHDSRAWTGIVSQDGAPTSVPAADVKAGRANLFFDAAMLTKMRESGILNTGQNFAGFLTVDDAPVLLEHQEHAAIEIPPGEYYVSRQTSVQNGALASVLD